MPIRFVCFALMVFSVNQLPSFGQLCENVVEPTPTGIETLLSSVSGVDLFSLELTPPCDGFQAAIVEARARNADASLITLTNISLSGAHQVTSSLGQPTDTALGWPTEAAYHPEWEFLDSHFLVTDAMIGGGVYTMRETNDGTTSERTSLPPVLGGAGTAKTGYGTTRTGLPTDAFFVLPEFQQQSLELAYVVSEVGNERPVQMTFGILGPSFVQAGKIDEAAFGYGGNPTILFPASVTDPMEPPIEERIGSIIGATNYSESIDVFAGERKSFRVPVMTAPAPDSESFYSVSLTDVESRVDAGFQADFEDRSIPADFATDIFVTFQNQDVGSYSGDYSFSFNDGTVIEASLTANVISRPGFPNPGNQGDPFINQCLGEGERSDVIVFAEQGGVHLISVPVDLGREDLQATKVVACAIDPDAKIVTFTNLSIKNAHQVWAPNGIQSDGGTVSPPVAGPLYDESWIPLDTHLLIPPDMIGGGVYSTAETNDGLSRIAETLPTILESQAAVSGYGATGLTNPTDAFFLRPEFQQASVEVAYVVTGAEGSVEMTLGVLGSGIIDAGTRSGAAFGYDGSSIVNVPFSAGVFVPEPNFGIWPLLLGIFFLGRRVPGQ